MDNCKVGIHCNNVPPHLVSGPNLHHYQDPREFVKGAGSITANSICYFDNCIVTRIATVTWFEDQSDVTAIYGQCNTCGAQQQLTFALTCHCKTD